MDFLAGQIPAEKELSVAIKSTTVALTLGDAAGIGPELLAKALSTTPVPEGAAWVIVGDRWVWERAQQFANVSLAAPAVADERDRGQRADDDRRSHDGCAARPWHGQLLRPFPI